MKTLKFCGFPVSFVAIILLYIIPFQSCKPDDDDDMLYKPNIYIYPQETISLNVKIAFPIGGKVVKSIPEYSNGWNVTVEPGGLINNKYNYLFYESTQPDKWQKTYGWVIRKNDLESFFKENMDNYGFSKPEIQDFTDYWIPRLNGFEFYTIYPQTTETIKNIIEIHFSREPQNFLRLYYIIKGQNDLSNADLTPPAIEKFAREGFYATEWGVILK